jgi:hypothetical protein
MTTENQPDELTRLVGERLRRECLSEFGSTWSNDVAWRFARAAIDEVRREQLRSAVLGQTDGEDVL